METDTEFDFLSRAFHPSLVAGILKPTLADMNERPCTPIKVPP